MGFVLCSLCEPVPYVPRAESVTPSAAVPAYNIVVRGCEQTGCLVITKSTFKLTLTKTPPGVAPKAEKSLSANQRIAGSPTLFRRSRGIYAVEALFYPLPHPAA